jgi:hypothetical protein
MTDKRHRSAAHSTLLVADGVVNLPRRHREVHSNIN